jgi:hypothetical protein
MEINEIIGTIVLCVALVLITALTLWARKSINAIKKVGPRSARELIKGKDNGGN